MNSIVPYIKKFFSKEQTLKRSIDPETPKEISLSECKLFIYEYFDSLKIEVSCIEEKKKTIRGNYVEVIKSIEEVQNRSLKLFDIRYPIIKSHKFETEQQFFFAIVNPQYIIEYSNGNYELIELSKEFTFNRRLYNKDHIILNCFKTGRFIELLCYGYNREPITKAYRYFLNNNSYLIQYPNKFIEVCEKKDGYKLFRKIINKELINFKLLLEHIESDCTFALYLYIIKNNLQDKISLLLDKFIYNCPIIDILQLIRSIRLKENKPILSIINLNTLFSKHTQIHILYNKLMEDEELREVLPNKNFLDLNQVAETCSLDYLLEFCRIIIDNKDFDICIALKRCLVIHIDHLLDLIPNVSEEHINTLYRRFNHYETPREMSSFDLEYNYDNESERQWEDRIKKYKILQKPIYYIDQLLGKNKQSYLHQMYNKTLSNVLLGFDENNKSRDDKKDIDYDADEYMDYESNNSNYSSINSMIVCADLEDRLHLFRLVMQDIAKGIIPKEKVDIDDILTGYYFSPDDIPTLYVLIIKNNVFDFDINKMINQWCAPSLRLFKMIMKNKEISNERKNNININNLIRKNNKYETYQYLITEVYPTGLLKDQIDNIDLSNLFNGYNNDSLYELLLTLNKPIDVNIVIKEIRCNMINIFRLTPNKHSIDLKLMFSNSYDEGVLELWRAVKEEQLPLPNDLDVNHLLRKCNDYDALELYMEVTQDLNYMPLIDSNMVIKECIDYDKVELYELILINISKCKLVIPPNFLVDFDKLVERCDRTEISQLIELRDKYQKK